MRLDAWIRKAVLLSAVVAVAFGGSTGVALSAVPEGVVEVVVEKAFPAVDSALRGALRAGNLITVAEMDFQAMQKLVGHNIAAAKAYMFFRPDLGIAIFEQDPTATLELPPRIVIMDLGGGKTALRYKKFEPGLSRYGLGELGRKIDDLQATIVKSAAR